MNSVVVLFENCPDSKRPTKISSTYGGEIIHTSGVERELEFIEKPVKVRADLTG